MLLGERETAFLKKSFIENEQTLLLLTVIEKLTDRELLWDEGLQELVVLMEVLFCVILENEFHFVDRLLVLKNEGFCIPFRGLLILLIVKLYIVFIYLAYCFGSQTRF